MTLKAFRTRDLLRGLPAAFLILAIFAQALIPSGWMPNLQDADGAVVLCSTAGNDANDQIPSSSNDRHLGQMCPYAATAIATPPQGPALFIARNDDYSIRWPVGITSFAGSETGPPFGSRAPPIAA